MHVIKVLCSIWVYWYIAFAIAIKFPLSSIFMSFLCHDMAYIANSKRPKWSIRRKIWGSVVQVTQATWQANLIAPKTYLTNLSLEYNLELTAEVFPKTCASTEVLAILAVEATALWMMMLDTLPLYPFGTSHAWLHKLCRWNYPQTLNEHFRDLAPSNGDDMT